MYTYVRMYLCVYVYMEMYMHVRMYVCVCREEMLFIGIQMEDQV